MAVLSAYMPEQLPEEKIRELVQKAVEQSVPREKRRLGKSYHSYAPSQRQVRRRFGE